MKPSLTLEFIREAADSICMLRQVLLKISKAKSLDEAQNLAKAVLEETVLEDQQRNG